ncbi:riboflavin synthase [uncultured Sneathiella sp.]|mgnify:FL=1|jgi:riboflavin synthase|uniref:riboflavin synthase n=1 Tax=uncultured Sneathiella sp. TaxID=879315 RepID=UPI0030D98C45|tara:strand:- start:47 stop:643 length:597 start_codon:yes stop_codon:yes gene_type:complete
MFTGIITDVGRVRGIEKTGDTRFEIETSYDTDTIDIGASIACSGPCLTVVEKGEGWFAVDVSDETLSCTNLDEWREGTRVNLERALKIGDELGGHVVTGHVDAVVTVLHQETVGDSTKLIFSLPAKYAGLVAAKGSICLDGISLTVNEVGDDTFSVNIIPHTQDHTSFDKLTIGRRINFEIDVLARYVARMTEVNNKK